MSLSASLAEPSSASASLYEGYICETVGECLPCPQDRLDFPYCRPYNNRQQVSCVPVGEPESAELLGWSACGKFTGLEVRHYAQFVLCNVLVMLVAAFLYAWRQRYQTLKFRSMLQQRVHGRRPRAHAIPR